MKLSDYLQMFGDLNCCCSKTWGCVCVWASCHRVDHLPSTRLRRAICHLKKLRRLAVLHVHFDLIWSIIVRCAPGVSDYVLWEAFELKLSKCCKHLHRAFQIHCRWQKESRNHREQKWNVRGNPGTETESQMFLLGKEVDSEATVEWLIGETSGRGRSKMDTKEILSWR